MNLIFDHHKQKQSNFVKRWIELKIRERERERKAVHLRNEIKSDTLEAKSTTSSL